MNKKRLIFFTTLILIIVVNVSLVSSAQESEKNNELSPQKSVTIENPQISTDELKLWLKPLTKKELAQEAQAWLVLLQSKLQEISNAEIQVKRQNNNTEASEENLHSERLIANITELQAEKSDLVQRVNLVLKEWELKGGDITDSQKYVEAISGVEVDLTDTDNLGLRISTWLKSEEGAIHWLLSTLRFLGILIACLFLGWIVNRVYQTAHSKYLVNYLDSKVEPIFRRTIHIIIWIITGIFALSSVGFNVTALITSLGIGGLAFALASQETIANLFGGVTLLMQKKIKKGERIEIDGIKARVMEIGLRNTVLKELEYDYEIFIPNAKFASQIVHHIDSRPHYSVYEFLHLHHNTTSAEIKLALQLIKEIAQQNSYIKSARPSFQKFGDYNFEIKFVYWIKKWEESEKELFPNDLWKMYTVRTQMNLAIMNAFEANQIRLALPIKIYGKGEETKSQGIFSSVKSEG